MYKYAYIALLFSTVLLLGFGVSGVFAESFDPTRPVIFDSKPKPAAKVKVDKSAYKVTSILVSPYRRVAVINNQVVITGEKVDKAKVIEIKKTGVALQVGKARFVASLPSAAIDKGQAHAPGSEK